MFPNNARVKLNHRVSSTILALIGAVVSLFCMSCGDPATTQQGNSEEEFLSGGNIAGVPEAITNKILNIESRAMELVQNDQAAIVATDMLQASNPDRNKLGLIFTEKVSGAWYVYFGQYIEEVKEFKAGYVFVCNENGVCQSADVNHQTENTNQFAAAIVNAMSVVEKQVPSYNANIFREIDSTITVYFTPGNTDPNIVLFGGDYKIRLSADGSQILGSEKLHMSIMDIPSQAEMIFHSHITSDLPSETDVAFIIMNPHFAPHFAGTEHWLTRIDANGKVVVVDRR